MKILFLYGGVIDPQKGGIERVTSVLADEFVRSGHVPYYLSRPSSERSSNSSSGRQFFLPEVDYSSERNSAFFKEFLKEKGIDVVVNQGGSSPACSQFAYKAKELGIPVVSVCHCGLIDSAKNYRQIHENAWLQRGLGWLIPVTDWRLVKSILMALYKCKYKAHYRELCKKSDKVVLLSESFKSELAFYFDGKNCPENVIAISNPCSFSFPERGLDFSEKQKELLWVGRIDFSPKRIDLMLKIWEKLFVKFPDWKLTILGGGDGLDDAKKMAQELKLERASFEGFQDPRPYYERASIFCMTSAWETFGLVLVEAMNFGCVPVAFNSYSAAKDIIDDGENGRLISPMNCEEYQVALEELMINEEKRSIIASSAQKKSLSFSPSRIFESWDKVLSEISTK